MEKVSYRLKDKIKPTNGSSQLLDLNTTFVIFRKFLNLQMIFFPQRIITVEHN